MYCTGGIRCEKASAYYKHRGFQNVYQLEGGIIEYARQVKNQQLENKIARFSCLETDIVSLLSLCKLFFSGIGGQVARFAIK